MPIYEIPLCRRVANVTKNVTSLPKKIEILHIGAVGIFLLYDEENEKNLSFIKKHLAGEESSFCFIEASNHREAIKKFHIEYDGARIGGKSRKERALWINEKQYIFELPHCELLHKNKAGEFICGDLSEEGEGDQGEWGMCVLEGYSSPPNCPISEFYEKWSQRSVSFLKVRGFKVVESLSY